MRIDGNRSEPSAPHPPPERDWATYEAFASDEEAWVTSVEDLFDRDLDDWLAAQERMNHTFRDDW